MNIAFYAPMKSPDHSVPSGDRRVARLLLDALKEAGYDPELASDLRTFDKEGNIRHQEVIRDKSLAEAERLILEYTSRPKEDRPALWFTYHLYHKAPDWIGPEVCRALDIPYVVAEASHAPKQETGQWSIGYLAAADAISFADRVFHMTALDGECLRPIVKANDTLVYLPPFIDDMPMFESQSDPAATLIGDAGGKKNVFNLLSVAMMRSGDKLQSYRQLSEALAYLSGDDWQLILVGDGDERQRVESYFEPYGNRILYTGALNTEELSSLYHYADLYIWPAHGEAYGMAFLEAQLRGLPVVAGDIRGVPDVVLAGKTGLLCQPGDMQDFARKIRQLLDDPQARHAMGDHARHFVTHERSLKAAADGLARQIGKLVQ